MKSKIHVPNLFVMLSIVAIAIIGMSLNYLLEILLTIAAITLLVSAMFSGRRLGQAEGFIAGIRAANEPDDNSKETSDVK